MIMADVLKIFLLVVGAMMVLVCYWLAAEALFPSLVSRSRRQYEKHPVRITLWGLAAGVPLVLIGIAIVNAVGGHPLGQMIGGGLVLATLLAGILGSTGLPQLIGYGLPSPVDAVQPWRRVLRGGIILAFTYLLPFAGWFLLTAWTVASGFGAAVISFREARKERRSSPEPDNGLRAMAA
jgi:hypothetical protein